MNKSILTSPFHNLVKKTALGLQKENSEDVHFVNVLNVGYEALLARIHLIRSARKSIVIQTYIWMYDEVGRLFVYELFKAAQRGVHVRIVIDQWVDVVGGHVNLELMAFMASGHPKLEVQYYNPSFQSLHPSAADQLKMVVSQFRSLNQRMHNKIFVVDGEVAITGGRNYENDYFDRSLRRNFKDRDVLVIGPVAGEMQASFEEYWVSELTVSSREILEIKKIIEHQGVKKLETKEDFQLEGEFEDINQQADDESFIEEAFIQKAHQVRKVKFVADSPGKNKARNLKGSSLTAFELRIFLEQAEKSIVIQSPYLVLDPEAVQRVKNLKRFKPNIDVRISTNSLAATDNLFAYAFSHKQRKQFVKDLKFRIFELRPVPADIRDMLPRYVSLQEKKEEIQYAQKKQAYSQTKDNNYEYPDVHTCIHAKTFVVDEDMTWIGSFNVDPRSAHLNTEVGLMIWDKAVAQEVKANIERDMAPQNSWTVGRAPQMAIRTFFSGIISTLISTTRLIKFWPFRYTHCFDIKEDNPQVPFYHEDFYQNYYSVGPFPQVKENTREVEIDLLHAIGGWAKDIV